MIETPYIVPLLLVTFIIGMNFIFVDFIDV